MNEERSFERFVADHIAGAAGQVRMPDDFYDDIHAFASRTRQRPGWLALIKEPPMRINSTVSVGSPIARIAVIIATTLLLAVLGVGALVVGAQSPSPLPADTPPLSFFTGTGPTDACPIAEPVVEMVDGVEQARGESWGCQEWSTTDPRFSGVAAVIWNQDTLTLEDGGGEIISTLVRLENAAGAWEGTLTELTVGRAFFGSAGWLTGEGAYDGLVAYVMFTDENGIRGVIRPDDGFGPPEAFAS